MTSPNFGCRDPNQVITTDKKSKFDPATRPAAGQRLEITNASILMGHGLIPNSKDLERSKSFDNLMTSSPSKVTFSSSLTMFQMEYA